MLLIPLGSKGDFCCQSHILFIYLIYPLDSLTSSMLSATYLTETKMNPTQILV
jgi:hypothetical protein